jgi:hypothetical protein
MSNIKRIFDNIIAPEQGPLLVPLGAKVFAQDGMEFFRDAVSSAGKKIHETGIHIRVGMDARVTFG